MADSIVLSYFHGFFRRLGFARWVRDSYGDDFLGEETGFLSGRGAGVGCGAKVVLVGATDVVPLCYVFARDAHGHYTISRFFYGGGFQFGPEDGGNGFGSVVPCHRFRARTYAYVNAADGDGVGNCGNGL